MVDTAESAYNAIAAQLAEWDNAAAADVEGGGDTNNINIIGGAKSTNNKEYYMEEEPYSTTNVDGTTTTASDIIAVMSKPTFRTASSTGNKKSSSSSRSSYRKNQEYHDAFANYLEQYHNATKRLYVKNQQLLNDGGFGDNMQEEEEEEEILKLQKLLKKELPTKFMKELISITSSSSSQSTKISSQKDEANNEEWNAWTLLCKLLHTNGIEATIYNPPPSSTKVVQLFQWNTDNFIDVNLYPAQLVHKALTTDPHSIPSPQFRDFLRVLQRRVTIVQWIEACIAHKQDPILLLPPKTRNIPPWKSSSNNKNKHLHLDSSTTTTKQQQQQNVQDAIDEAELLKVVITMIQCGNLNGAKQCCQDAGQSWRAATLIGGQYYGMATTTAATSGSVVTVIGNPNRMQWKKQCQLLGQELFQRVQREGIGTTSTDRNNIAYEAALYAILARDVPRALQNPMLQSSWYTQLWIYFSAMVECSLDQLLEYHTVRQNESIGTKFPFSSATHTFPDQHQDYVDITATIDEMEIINAVSTNINGNNNNDKSNNNPYRMIICSVIAGKEAIYNYLMQYVYPLCQQQQQQLSLQGNTNSVTAASLSHDVLRFITHFILMLRLSFSEEFPELPYNHEMMVVLKTYIHSLMSSTYKKYNLPLIALYTSLLSPEEMLIDTYVSCCLLEEVNNNDDTDENETIRKMMVDLARQHFSNGLDLIILRRVVKNIIEDSDNTTSKEENGYVSSMLVPYDDGDSTTNDNVVTLHSSDLHKLQGLQWLCFYPEHRLDAIVLANALLRRLLLAASPTTESVEDDVFTLRSTNYKLILCKIFITKYFPTDSRSVVQEYYLATASSADDYNNEPCTVNASIDAAVLTEHSALIAFLEAHTAFEEWCQVITLCEQSQPPSWGSDNPQLDRFSSGWNAAEKEIARQQEYRLYRHKMANLARTALQMTETAQRALLNVLTFPGGWLDHQVCGIQAMKSITSLPPEEWDLNSRENEIFSLRKIFIFRSLIMLHSVLDGTASWVQKFSSGIDVQQERELFHEFGDDQLSLFQPQYWHKKSLELSELVVDHDLQETMSREQLQCFLRLMAESAVSLMRCAYNSTTD